MSNSKEWQDEISDVADGMGCTEIWETLCEKRDSQDTEASVDSARETSSETESGERARTDEQPATPAE